MTKIRAWIEENRGFWLLLACTLIPIFFQLDRIMGAVWLKTIYTEVSFICAMLLLMLLLLSAVIVWCRGNWLSGIAIIAPLLIVFVLIAYFLGGMWSFIGWLVAVPVSRLLQVPTLVFVLVAIVLIGLHLAYHYQVILTNILRINGWVLGLIALILFCLMPGMPLPPPSTIPPRIVNMLQTGNRLYQLQVMSDIRTVDSYWTDTLLLYECNSVGLWCEEIHTMHTYEQWGYSIDDNDVSLQPETVSNTIQIIIDNNIVYTHSGHN